MSERLLWVTGAGGLIGSQFVRLAPTLAYGWRVRGMRRDELNLTDADAIRRLFAAEKPAAIIHCAAISKTPACQADPALARRINVEATALLSELAAEIPFVFFSTDLVFDGRKGDYDEAAAPNPLNVYAETKAQAEQVVLRNPRHMVIRTSLNGGVSPTGNRGFNEETRNALRSGKTLNLFTDEFRNPIAAHVTARAIIELLQRGAAGLFHVAGSERLSRWEIGQLLVARWGGGASQLRAGALRDYTGPTRAPDTTLNCAKAQWLLSFPLPRFSEWLRDHPAEPF